MTVYYFNSRPHGGRLSYLFLVYPRTLFQLTPSRRATSRSLQIPFLDSISTHALTEGDQETFLNESDILYFNSRPHGGRQDGTWHYQETATISTHALTEGDSCSMCNLKEAFYFNSRPHGGRRIFFAFRRCETIFQLTPSRRATLFGR